VDFHVTLDFNLQSFGAGFLIFMGPWLSAPKSALGWFVDFHVTLAFSVQSAWAGSLIFMGPWPSAPNSALADLWIFR
jgi:hypothetical protein